MPPVKVNYGTVAMNAGKIEKQEIRNESFIESASVALNDTAIQTPNGVNGSLALNDTAIQTRNGVNGTLINTTTLLQPPTS